MLNLVHFQGSDEEKTEKEIQLLKEVFSDKAEAAGFKKDDLGGRTAFWSPSDDLAETVIRQKGADWGKFYVMHCPFLWKFLLPPAAAAAAMGMIFDLV